MVSVEKDGGRVFDLTLSEVSQCVVPGTKMDEVEIQFHESDTSSSREKQDLVAMRLWVPGGQANEIRNKVITQTNISSVTGSVLVEFDRDQGNFILPRSRYSVELYDRFLRLHGSTYEYKIQYDDIDRFYMLQKPNGKHFHFVICLDKPILQGQQKYPYLVWMPTNDETKINVNMDEEAIEERFAEQEKHGIKPVMSGALHSLVARVFRAFSGKDVYSHSKRFESADKNHCISCAHQARNGFLYPNDKSFVYLHQPTIVIMFQEIAHVEFERGEANKASTTRNFDFVVTLKSIGGDRGKQYQFGSIKKEEYVPLMEFLKTKPSITIRNLEEVPQDLGEEDEDDDDDEVSVPNALPLWCSRLIPLLTFC